jgi:hypothetical protein
MDLLGEHREDFPPEYLHWAEQAGAMSGLDFFRDQGVRTEIYKAFQGVLKDYDLLITPTLACPPVDNASDGNTVGPSMINGETVDPLIGWCLTYFVNFTGHPAASIPAGMLDGLPVGMQIIGRRGGDADVLAASAAFERLRPWQKSYEICAARPSRGWPAQAGCSIEGQCPNVEAIVHQQRGRGGRRGAGRGLARVAPEPETFEINRSDDEWRSISRRAICSAQGRAHGTRGIIAARPRAPQRDILCAGCDLPIYASDAKFDSRTGWPSFTAPIAGSVRFREDRGFLGTRTEVHCRRCGGHLARLR